MILKQVHVMLKMIRMVGQTALFMPDDRLVSRACICAGVCAGIITVMILIGTFTTFR